MTSPPESSPQTSNLPRVFSQPDELLVPHARHSRRTIGSNLDNEALLAQLSRHFYDLLPTTSPQSRPDTS